MNNNDNNNMISLLQWIDVHYDDFLQEAYIAFFNSLINFNENKNVLLYSYVVMCVRRKMMSFCKKISKSCKNISYNNYDEFIDILDTKSDVYSRVNNSESEKMLRNVILDLSFIDSAIVELRINGFSYKEISHNHLNYNLKNQSLLVLHAF